MAGSLNLSGVSLLGFEVLGKLILEELQLIRKDMKDEIRKVGAELKELYGTHKKILNKLDNKLTDGPILIQENEKNVLDDASLDRDLCEDNAKTEEPPLYVLPAITEKKNQDSNEVLVIDNDDSVHSSASVNHPDICDVSNMFEGKNIVVKEEVSSFEKTDLGNCFGDTYDEPQATTNAASYDSTFTNSTEQSVFIGSSSNDLFNSKYSICNPLLKKTESKNVNVPENGPSKMLQSEIDFDLPSSFPADTYSSTTNISEASSSTMMDLDFEENFRCQFCRKPFRHFSSYQSHVRTHTGEKPFTCSLCNKNFTQKGNLTKHMLLHQNQKPFKCEICGKQFAQKGSMKSHMLRHTKNDFFKCGVCDKTFRQLTHLVAHEQVHKM